MRLFLAIVPTDEIRAAVAAMQDRLKRATGVDVRWDNPDKFHLTVKFIGDQSEANRENIEAVCADVAAATTPFRIAVRGAGAFPKRGPVRTLWAGVPEGAAEWRALALRAEEPLAAFGVPREGGLAPHLTLGRVKVPRGSTLGEAESDALRAALATEAGTDCGSQTVDRVTLIKSTLDPRGAIYTPLREWPLGDHS